MTIQKQKAHSALRHAARFAGIAAAVGLAAALVTATRGQGDLIVRAGEDLQGALDSAGPGDVIRLEAGAVFEGNFVLPAKAGADEITIRSSADDRDLPAPSQRIGLQHERFVPTIRSPNTQPALRTAAGARHWRIVGVQFRGSGGADVLVLGDGTRAQSAYDQIAQDLVLDRVIVRGDPERGQKRGIALNSGATTIRNSYIADIKAVGQETQAIAGWNGPGPYVIENNYLEAAGVIVLFGGSEPFIGNLVPSDIVFRGNHVTRPLEWRDSSWTVKNLFELKNARRVLVEGNLFERNWSAAQAGYAILFTPRNPGNRARWSVVEAVTFQNNIVRDVAAGINILGYDTAAVTQQTHGILIRNNLFDSVDHHKWGGNGTFLQMGDEPADLTVEHNTIIQTGNVITAYGGAAAARRPIRGFRFANNIAFHNSYGISGNGEGFGAPAIARYFPGGEIMSNVLAGGPEGRYPPGNLFPAVEDLMQQFVDAAAGDYRLRGESWMQETGGDGGPLGVDYAELNRAMSKGLGIAR